jgi:hypothetical protein
MGTDAAVLGAGVSALFGKAALWFHPKINY